MLHLIRPPFQCIGEHLWLTAQPMGSTEPWAQRSHTVEWIVWNRPATATYHPHRADDDQMGRLPLPLGKGRCSVSF
jgi:hypothetical protein